ncbi:MAG: glycosyltransferase family 4 protein [Crocinitomicaceae bacterium]|nr:glycosyltransferase family 4 protein [Crocinitomicaceae bacterium]
MNNLLIIYARNNSELLNRKSAIGSYIHCLAKLLESDFDNVFLNGMKIKDQKVIEPGSTQINSNFIKKKLSQLIPKSSKLRRSENFLIEQHKLILDEVVNLKEPFNHILEFYTIGSNVGLKLKSILNSRLSVVYDGPSIEEYVFFNGRKPINYKTFLENERMTLQAASRINCYSGPVKSHIVEEFDVSAEKITVHQNIDFTRFESDEPSKINDTVNICFIGSFLHWHRVDLLIHAFDKLLNENSVNADLYLIGDGILKSKMEKEAKTLNTSNRIHFTGYLDGKELYNLKKQMHIGIMPGSNWYGAPNKIFEYGGMGMACMAPSTPTIDYIFNDQEIVFFELDNFESFFKELKTLVTSEEKINSMSKGLKSKIESDYGPEQTRNYYRRMLLEDE